MREKISQHNLYKILFLAERCQKHLNSSCHLSQNRNSNPFQELLTNKRLVAIALNHGLTYQEFEAVISAFPLKLTSNYREFYLASCLDQLGYKADVSVLTMRSFRNLSFKDLDISETSLFGSVGYCNFQVTSMQGISFGDALEFSKVLPKWQEDLRGSQSDQARLSGVNPYSILVSVNNRCPVLLKHLRKLMRLELARKQQIRWRVAHSVQSIEDGSNAEIVSGQRSPRSPGWLPSDPETTSENISPNFQDRKRSYLFPLLGNAEVKRLRRDSYDGSMRSDDEVVSENSASLIFRNFKTQKQLNFSVIA